ncbi:hypothetical protein GIB67_004613, partial [Kingdonia uniflora]
MLYKFTLHLLMTCHSQWCRWIRKFAVHDLIVHPFVSCFGVVNPIPVYSSRRLFTRSSHHFSAIYIDRCTTTGFATEIILSTISETYYKRLFESYQKKRKKNGTNWLTYEK